MHPQVIIKILFCGEFLPLGDQKKANPTKGFFRIKKKNHHISRKKS